MVCPPPGIRYNVPRQKYLPMSQWSAKTKLKPLFHGGRTYNIKAKPAFTEEDMDTESLYNLIATWLAEYCRKGGTFIWDERTDEIKNTTSYR